MIPIIRITVLSVLYCFTAYFTSTVPPKARTRVEAWSKAPCRCWLIVWKNASSPPETIQKNFPVCRALQNKQCCAVIRWKKICKQQSLQLAMQLGNESKIREEYNSCFFAATTFFEDSALLDLMWCQIKINWRAGRFFITIYCARKLCV